MTIILLPLLHLHHTLTLTPLLILSKKLKYFKSPFSKHNISFTPEPRGFGYGWIKNVYNSVTAMCHVYSRSKEIAFIFESLNENDIDNLRLKLENKYDIEKTCGKKNNDLVRLTVKNKITYNEKPIEMINKAANEFIDILNYINLKN